MPATAPRPAAKFTFDRNFQKRMLRVLYQDQEFTATTAVHLQAEHFETPAYRWLAQHITAYAKKHGVGIGEDALRIEMDRDRKLGRLNKETQPKVELLIGTLDRPVKDKSFIKEELFRFIKNQTTRQAILNSLDHLEAMDYDSIDEEFQKVLEVTESLSGGLGQFYVRDIRVRTKRRKEYVKNGVPSGLGRLDDFLKPSGLPPKTLGCVVAPSGKGKSHCLVHIGKSGVLAGAKVLHITTELSDEAILDRYDSAFAAIAINKLEIERRTIRSKVRELGKKWGEMLVVKEFPPATLTAAGIRAYVRQLERVAFYPTVIIVDSADDMLPSVQSRDKDAYDDMGNVYRELRRLSFELAVPVWTASQTNKTALNKEFVDWDSIADSSKKVMVADLVVILLQTLEEKKVKQARFFIAKNRQGSDKIDFKVRLDWGRSTIRNA